MEIPYKMPSGTINCSDPTAVNCCPFILNPALCSDCIGCDGVTISGPKDGRMVGVDFWPQTSCTNNNTDCIYEVVCADPTAVNYDTRCDRYPGGNQQCISADVGRYCYYNEEQLSITKNS